MKCAGLEMNSVLRQGGRSLSQSRERQRARSALVSVEVALALVLLVSSGLMIRTFQSMRHVAPGFTRPEEVQTLRISIPRAQVNNDEDALRMQEAVMRKIATIPGVQAVSFAGGITMDGSSSLDPHFTGER